MSFYANGGFSARIAFLILSVWWISFTTIAFYKAIKKDFFAHRAFMIRNYALTRSALSLLAWKALLEAFTILGQEDRYKIIAWLGWGLNLRITGIIRLFKGKPTTIISGKKPGKSFPVNEQPGPLESQAEIFG